MRYHDKGRWFGVTVSKDEVTAFKRKWPVSGLGAGPYHFKFNTATGDLVDVRGPGADSYADGPALGVLSRDAQVYGNARRAGKSPDHGRY